MIDPKKYEEFRRVAALLALDIEIMASAFPENKELERLAIIRKNVIENEEYRNMRFESTFQIVNLKKHKVFKESLPKDSVQHGFYEVPDED